jgi:2-dehydro-3-deoxyphosphooctonate aldolase (KDO 8-P synthase)
MTTVKVENIEIGNNKPFVLIAGPCVVESEKLVLSIAEKIKEITFRLKIPYIFKSSYKKANRTSGKSFMGIGDLKALKILSKVKKEFNIPVLTDIHVPQDAKVAAEYIDVLQIPAFLSRQTDLLIAAGKTGKIINIKKGQFLAPTDMKFAAEKVQSTGNNNILLTERGTFFGYHNLVVDFRSLLIMKKLGYPVVMDATHSVQQPSKTNQSGGEPEFTFPLAKAAVSVGIEAIFLETHPIPEKALSDSAIQFPLSKLEEILKQLSNIDRLIKKY